MLIPSPGLLALAGFILLTSSAYPAQQLDPAQTASLTGAVRRLESAQTAQTRFTRFHLEHNQVFREDGRPLTPTEKLYEDTWINNLPYKHLVQIDGKPLAGKDLASEQARLDKALADHHALDLLERARQTHGHLISTGLGLEKLLSPAYRVVFRHNDTCEGTPCAVYAADSTDPTLQPAHSELWVVETPSPFLFRLTYEYTADRGEARTGTNGLLEYTLFNNTPVEQHTHFGGPARVGNHYLRVETDNRFSRYRQFTTTVTLRPGTETQP